MKRRPAAVLAAPLLLAVSGCGGGGSGPVALVDASAEATLASREDAGGDGDCFPFCVSADASIALPGEDAETTLAEADGAMTCPQLQASYEAALATAQACDPRLPGQCSVAVNDPCCPITVGGNATAVDDFSEAVTSYTQHCTANCSARICRPVPTGQCVATATSTGACL